MIWYGMNMYRKQCWISRSHILSLSIIGASASQTSYSIPSEPSRRSSWLSSAWCCSHADCLGLNEVAADQTKCFKAQSPFSNQDRTHCLENITGYLPLATFTNQEFRPFMLKSVWSSPTAFFHWADNRVAINNICLQTSPHLVLSTDSYMELHSGNGIICIMDTISRSVERQQILRPTPLRLSIVEDWAASLSGKYVCLSFKCPWMVLLGISLIYISWYLLCSNLWICTVCSMHVHLNTCSQMGSSSQAVTG